MLKQQKIDEFFCYFFNLKTNIHGSDFRKCNWYANYMEKG